VAAWHQELYDNNINQKYSGIGVLQNQKTAGAAARWWWQRRQQRQFGGGNGSGSVSGSLATARRQGLHDNNINQKYSGIGYYKTKRLRGQQCGGNCGGSDGSLAAAAAARQQRGIRGRTTTTSIKILRDRVFNNHKTAGAAARQWWQRQLGSSSWAVAEATWRQHGVRGHTTIISIKITQG
jgi:hypothetical protein